MKVGRVTKLLPQQPVVSHSSAPLHAQLPYRPVAVQNKNLLQGSNANDAYTGEVEFMSADEFKEFPGSISSICP